MKAAVVFPHLLLQKPSKKSKAKDHMHVKHLQRRLELWKDGNVESLLRESKCIQDRMASRNRPMNPACSSTSNPTKHFVKQMEKGNVRNAIRTLSQNKTKGVLKLNDMMTDGFRII